ncbi:MAG: hypothetical protein K5894_02925 [Lachnospiraceae bacterium]|nr:hypothetical protein [Lachnospiraceae bacterium]
MTVGLCLLTWNELEGCKHDLPLIDKSQFEQIYCIDGGSTDGTVEYLQEQGVEVYQQQKPGLNQACIQRIIKFLSLKSLGSYQRISSCLYYAYILHLYLWK